MAKLFGTDGIRGKANRYPITAEMAVRIGRSAALFFKKETAAAPHIVLANDSRISGDMIAAGLSAGICAAGTDAVCCGVLPTPAVAWMAAAEKAAAGISVSASHNPYDDNGVKIFRGNGFKLSQEDENRLEQLILSPEKDLQSTEAGRVRLAQGKAADGYAAFLVGTAPGLSLNAMRIVLDCANGATSHIAPALFAGMGADVVAIFNNPDGKNINAGCGSEHPRVLQRKVVETGADIGLAFDGDGDRLTAVDEAGGVLSGDQLLAICAQDLIRNRKLKNNLVISTVMSNIGLGLALRDMGIRHIMTDVGDREVMEKMKDSGAVLGGEDSGHLIFRDHHSTGDGMLSALQLLRIVKTTSKPLSGLARVMTVFPQTLINVEVRQKPDLEGIGSIQDAIRKVKKKLAKEGRVLVRYSGTQPLCRIMVEGPTAAQTQAYCRELADAVRNVLG